MSEKRLLTVLNFSGGQQSSAILWMILRDEIQVPDPFVVINADPGMENSETYVYIERMKKLCFKNGIPFIKASGPNLYQDILNLSKTNKTRFDTPPYWTKNKDTGKKGRMLQKCTQAYKIAPMDRAIRRILHAYYSINPKAGRFDGYVSKYIGFTVDEQHRVSEPSQQYVRFEYPLIDLGFTKEDTKKYFEKIGEEPPPRSVCNACFANSVSYFQEMKKNRPADFEQAVRVDNAIRDLSQIGVRDEVYVLNTLSALEMLKQEEEIPDTEDWSCDSGYCFV